MDLWCCYRTVLWSHCDDLQSAHCGFVGGSVITITTDGSDYYRYYALRLCPWLAYEIGFLLWILPAPFNNEPSAEAGYAKSLSSSGSWCAANFSLLTEIQRPQWEMGPCNRQCLKLCVVLDASFFWTYQILWRPWLDRFLNSLLFTAFLT